MPSKTPREIAIPAGHDWDKLFPQYELPDVLIVRIANHLGISGQDQLVYSDWYGAIRDALERADRFDRIVLVGKNGLGRALRKTQYGIDVSTVVDDVDAIYLCEIKINESSLIPFALFDIGNDDERSLIVTRREHFAPIFSLIKERGSNKGTIWRGHTIEKNSHLLEIDESEYILPRDILNRVLDQTVNFLTGEQAALLRQWKLLPKRGVILHGPPGNGKTLITRFCAQNALNVGLNVVIIEGKRRSSVSFDSRRTSLGDQLRAAAAHGPAILIFEDLDLHCPRREEGQVGGKTIDDSSGLAEMLEFLDGTVETNGYVLLATTNYLNRLDPALIRSGRLDEAILVPSPDLNTRKELLQKLLIVGPPEKVDVDEAAGLLEGCSYADIAEVARRYKISVVFSRGRSNQSMFDDAAREMADSRSRGSVDNAEL